MTVFAPFDNTKTLSDDAGHPVRFLIDPLSDTYIEPPGSMVPDGMLPPQDYEVRKALVEMKFATERLSFFSLIARFFRSKCYCVALEVAQQKQQDLMTMVNSSPEHKASIRRIVNAMPPGNSGREALADYLV
jgi:hypothetical protein